jgi:TPR repeat protein
MARLSPSKVASIKQPGRYGDGGGLLLNVKPTGAKSWLLRLQANGRRRDYGLGSVAKVSLAQARRRAADYRKLLAAGIDPLSEQGTEQAERMRQAIADRREDRVSLRRTRLAAAQGNAMAQSNLGYFHFRGNGVPQDYAEARRWFEAAAEQGNADARHNLAGMYASGTGVERDYAEAERLYRLAANQGHAPAQSNLGAFYANGIVVSQDSGEAEHWWRLAAVRGNADAQANLGALYCSGVGVKRDYAKAARWLHLAAEQGHPDAQYILGAMYGNGTGVVQDYVHAHMWFNLAAAAGNAESARNREIVTGKMTPEQISEAQTLARKIHQAYPQKVG